MRRLKRKRLIRPAAPMTQVQRADQEWSMDFVMDGLATGRSIRALTVVDSYTRWLDKQLSTSIAKHSRVTRTLEWIVAQRSKPEALRCDNGRVESFNFKLEKETTNPYPGRIRVSIEPVQFASGAKPNSTTRRISDLVVECELAPQARAAR